MALGIDSGGVFDRVLQDHTLKLDKGDCLVLYTDGVTEALDAAGAEYGLENMVQAIRESASNGPTAVLQRLTDELQSFVGGHPQHDDITLIAISKT
jgi:sigma-B regulation protein RsbU (phosphoserine phosphatase)